jgi:hypothetical protein
MGPRGTFKGVAALFFITAVATVGYAAERNVCEAPSAGAAAPPQGVLRLAGGFEKARGRAWMDATYRGLQVRKTAVKSEQAAAVELALGADVVRVVIVRGTLFVTRGGRTIAVDSPQALERLQRLLAGSTAVFAARALLSELEQASALKAPEMALLSSIALVASLVGDTEAPRRLADRFVERHRGIFRQIRHDDDEASCWSSYTTEVTSAWDELQACMQDAEDDGLFSGAWQRIACNATWAMRGESAWFEYLKCLSPLGSIPKSM